MSARYPIVQHSDLEPWLEDASQARLESIGNTGGLSGALIWRVTLPRREFCLRRWPQRHPSFGQLRAIHGLLNHVNSAGFQIVPVPMATRLGETYVCRDEYLWELAPWMPGEANFANPLPANRLLGALAALAKFHQAAKNYSFAGETARLAPSPGLQDRLDIIASLQQGGLKQLEQATRSAPASELRDLSVQLLETVSVCLDRVAEHLRLVVTIPLPLQWCLRDVRTDHVLFTGDLVSGLIDFGAAAVDSVVGDVVRLLGSLVNDDQPSWQAGLQAYEQHRSLSQAERRVIVAFDQSSLLCSAANWTRWLFVEARSFPQAAAIRRQLMWLRDRLWALASNSSASVSREL